MTKITFYGGIKEIGGNKILIESKEAKVFFDFGQSFSLLDEFFVPEAYLSPRNRFGLRDYFALNLIPKLKGLYSKDALKHTEIVYSEPEYDAIFLSHPHMDHFSHLEYIDPKIPVYMGETTERILRSTQKTTRTKIFYDDSDIKHFRTGNRISIGDLEISPIHVDHSVPGAYGFLIDSGEKRIVYSGDLRSHGKKPKMTEDFVNASKTFEPDVLIIEGTRVSKKETRKNHTENFVETESKRIVNNNKGLTLGMRYPKDLDRFQTFYSTAKENGKELVISPKTANLLLYLKDDPIGLPDPIKDETIKIYNREKLKYNDWEKELQTHCIDSEYIRQNQSNIILELDSYYMAELIDIKPEKGEIIHSMSEPFEEDPVSAMVDNVLRNWAETFNMTYNQLHASGHASKEEIFKMVEEIKPKKVIPVHTKNPNLFKKTVIETILVKK
ncbi:MAG: MBL fold metallo-hydrolase [Candidatus ainarchaeum sp.]|nr:MBL fold metallo-hydrolase [Candidatus ainarchaeum sp.]